MFKMEKNLFQQKEKGQNRNRCDEVLFAFKQRGQTEGRVRMKRGLCCLLVRGKEVVERFSRILGLLERCGKFGGSTEAFLEGILNLKCFDSFMLFSFYLF